MGQEDQKITMEEFLARVQFLQRCCDVYKKVPSGMYLHIVKLWTMDPRFSEFFNGYLTHNRSRSSVPVNRVSPRYWAEGFCSYITGCKMHFVQIKWHPKKDE